MFYVREKTNHLNILKWGYVTEASGLGDFDSNIYEVVGPGHPDYTGQLPEGWVDISVV